MSSDLEGSPSPFMAELVAPSMAKLVQAVQRYQAAVDDFDREVARLLGINSTDQRCLEILLVETEQATPRMLADRLGLTTGSVTAMLDRLEKLGYLIRAPHPTDGRKTIVRATELTRQRVHELISPLVEEGNHLLLSRYNPEQLELIIDYLNFDSELQQRHTHRLRAIRHSLIRTNTRTQN